MSKAQETNREHGREINESNSKGCNCPFQKEPCCRTEGKNIEIQITYINQRGKANIAGGGSMQYKGNDNQILTDVEDLKSGYKILSEVVELLKLRDK